MPPNIVTLTTELIQAKAKHTPAVVSSETISLDMGSEIKVKVCAKTKDHGKPTLRETRARTLGVLAVEVLATRKLELFDSIVQVADPTDPFKNVDLHDTLDSNLPVQSPSPRSPL